MRRYSRECNGAVVHVSFSRKEGNRIAHTWRPAPPHSNGNDDVVPHGCRSLFSHFLVRHAGTDHGRSLSALQTYLRSSLSASNSRLSFCF